MAKVTLWTRQDSRFLDAIKKEGVFYVKKEYIDEKFDDLAPYFIKLYSWFVENAEKRVPRPNENIKFPIWCSINSDYMLRGAHGNVLIELSIDEDKIVYFDSPKWDLVLNHNYIAKNAQDQEEFDEMLLKNGLKNSFILLDDKHRNFYPHIAKQIVKSWERIFDVNKDDENIFAVQANIWEIRPEDIVDIREGEKETPIKIALFESLKPK